MFKVKDEASTCLSLPVLHWLFLFLLSPDENTNFSLILDLIFGKCLEVALGDLRK